MKPQKIYRIGCCLIFLLVLLTVLKVEVWADSQEKQWIVFRDQIPEGSVRYSITLRYIPSDSIFYRVSHRNVKSVALPEDEQIDNYKHRINFDTKVEGCQYSMLLRPANELSVLNSERMRILMVRVLRSKKDMEPEVLQEGYFFCNNNLEISFEVPGQQLALPTTESVAGTLSIKVYGENVDSYRGSSTTSLKGSLTGSSLIEGANLEVSLSYKESLLINDGYVKLAVKPFNEKIPSDSTGGKITDVLKLRSAKLVVEKIASDSSEIVLAAIQGKLGQAPEVKSLLSVGKPVPAFARVDLIGRQLLTLDKLRTKARAKGYIVLIFGDLKRIYHPDEYYHRGRQVTSELTLDETMVLEILQRDLKYPPVVVFVCRRFSFSDLYEKWLGKDLGFYILADYSNPMEVQFWFPSPNFRPSHRAPAKMETLRGQFALPEDIVSVLLINGKGELVYIDIDAGQQLAECLTEINKLISSKN